MMACGASHRTHPLKTGESEVHVSVGGPLIKQGFVVPAPYAVLGYSYGLTDRIYLMAAWHITAALFKTFSAEWGAGIELLAQDEAIPEIMLHARLVTAADNREFVIFPILSPSLAYRLGTYTPYVGMDHLFQFHDNDRWYTPQALAPFVGLQKIWGERWMTGLELKWSAVNHNMKTASVDHVSAFGTKRGALAPYIYASWKF